MSRRNSKVLKSSHKLRRVTDANAHGPKHGPGPKLRKLTDEEALEENIYRHQIIQTTGWRPGEHPLDVYRREQEAKAKEED